MAVPTSAIRFPSDSVPQNEKKDKDWNLKFQKAIWSNQSSGSGAMLDTWINKIVNNRRYGQGLIDIDKFKNQIASSNNTAFMNLQWDVSTPVPVIVDNIVGQFMNQGYKVDALALNPESQVEYDKKKRELEVNKLLYQNADKIEELTGKRPNVDESEVFESKEEVELHLDLNWKQSECLAMESGINYVHKANNEEEIKKKIFRDLVEVGVGAKRVCFDEDLSIRERYVDPLNLLFSYTDNEDFSDVKYAGEIVYYTIDDLAVMTDFSDEQLMEIARSSSNKNGNGDWNTDWEKRYYPLNYGTKNPYADFRVKVLDAEYYSYDNIKYEKIPAKKGNGFYFQRVKNKPKNPDNVVTKRIKTIYNSKWVVNTDYIFDYGLKENMIREKIRGSYSNETPLSFVIYMPNMRDMQSKTLIEKMRPYANQLIIIQLKAQQLIAKMRPNGVAVDVAAVSGALAGLGEQAMSARDLQLIYEQTGNYYYSSLTEDGRQLNNTVPVRELPESVMQGLNQLVAMNNHYIQQLELVTGVPLSTVGAPDKDALVGIEKLKASSRNNSIRYIENAYKNILGRSSKMVALMIQDALKLGKGIQDFSMAIGKANTDILSLSKKIHLTEYGIFIDVLPDALEIATLEQQANQALAAKIIKQSDAMKVLRIGKQNTELAERYMELFEKKYTEEQAQLAQVAPQAQAQAQAMQYEAEQAAKQKTINMEWDRKDKHLRLEYQLKANESMQDHEEEIELQNEKDEGKIEQIEKAAQITEGADKGSESISGSIPKEAGIRQPKIPQSA